MQGNYTRLVLFRSLQSRRRLIGRLHRCPLSDFAHSVQELVPRAERGEFLSNDNDEPCNHQPKYRRTVTLLHPPGACSAFTRSGSQYPPLGLLQLKALIGDANKVNVLEADGKGWTNEETIEQLKKEVPRAIGMTVTCGTKPLAHAWSTVAKNLFPAKFQPLVVVGGPAAAFETPEIFKDCPNVDVVVKGEGEVTFPKIVKVLEKQHDAASEGNDVLAQLSLISGVVVRNHPNPQNDNFIPNLPKDAFESLPFPDLSESPVDRYRAPDALRFPMVTMMTQRGCVAQCAFCNTPQIHGKSIRGWTSEQVVSQLKHLKENHGIRQVSFVDDVFTNRPGGPRNLCEKMIEEKLNLTWYCNARADQITPRMASSMKKAGCHQVFLGFESGCDEMLKRINKGETVADLERGSKILKDAGIAISIGFIVGLPGETDSSVQASIDLCHRVRPDRVQFTRFTPIPGSALFLDLLVGDYDDSTSFHDRSQKDQIEAWLNKCYAECQYKPSV